MMRELPDAEALFAELTRSLKSEAGPETALVGIHTGGAWLAERLHRDLALRTPLGALDISFYRDDYGTIGLHPQVRRTAIPFEVQEREIILVDDVLYTGRTIRAAMNVLFDYGRAKRIRLATLVDRGGRELPIEAQFVGARIPIEADEMLDLKRDEQGRLRLELRKKEE
jgi:pyrimidine operon attenuation protein/uracil phosphoribosyltransferase